MVFVSLAGLVATQGGAHANRVNTPGVACALKDTAPGWGTTDPLVPPWQLKRLDFGGISNPDIRSHDVECPIVMSPTGLSTGIFVDGTQNAGTSTTCVIFDFTFSGTLNGTASFTATTTSFDQFVSLPSVGAFDYLFMRCTLQPSNKNTIRGVTANN